jgi:hypothetical protein
MINWLQIQLPRDRKFVIFHIRKRCFEQKIRIFWAMTMYSLVGSYQRFGGTGPSSLVPRSEWSGPNTISRHASVTVIALPILSRQILCSYGGKYEDDWLLGCYGM